MTCREHDAQRQHIDGWLVGEQEIRFDTVGSNTLANVPPDPSYPPLNGKDSFTEHGLNGPGHRQQKTEG